MNKPKLTIEGLLTDPFFIDYCLNDKETEDTNPWKHYVPDHLQDKERYDQAKNYVLLLTGKIPEEMIDSRLAEFKLLFQQRKDRKHPEIQLKTRLRRSLFVKMSIAASILLMSATAIFFYLNQRRKVFQFSDIRGETVYAPGKQRKTLVLADGTEAILYPGSRLIIPENFNAEERRIGIVGQVYLNVAPQAGKPFVAYSRHTRTIALGTSFYVRDFENSKESSVLLMTGKVKVTEPKHGASQILEPGTSVVLNHHSLALTRKAFPLKEMEELSQSRLNFENADMPTIISKLELYYGVEFDLSQCNCDFKKITGDYSDESLSAILGTISFINQLNWKIQGQKIMFEPRAK